MPTQTLNRVLVLSHGRILGGGLRYRSNFRTWQLVKPEHSFR